MKFESKNKFQKGISYSSLAAVVLLSAVLYLIVSKVKETPVLNNETATQKIDQQKKINQIENENKSSLNPSQTKETINEQTQVISKEESNPSVKKSNSRELGFDIDYGSEQPRIIRNFILPESKKPGSGRVVLKFRFTIRPDGSVSKVFPTMKGDADLELEAMNLLRKWRFEKLPASSEQNDQKAEISFRHQ